MTNNNIIKNYYNNINNINMTNNNYINYYNDINNNNMTNNINNILDNWEIKLLKVIINTAMNDNLFLFYKLT